MIDVTWKPLYENEDYSILREYPFVIRNNKTGKMIKRYIRNHQIVVCIAVKDYKCKKHTKWISYKRIIYNNLIGDIPNHYNVIAKDGNNLNFHLDNLELKTVSEIKKDSIKSHLKN